jgi:peroxiredoxin Q/BCP
MLNVGALAPDFALPDQDGALIKLSALKNKSNVILFFYPKDNSPGCSMQSCSFRDNYEDFKALNVQIFGISSDSIDSHKAFKKTLNLPFSLLSDTKGEVRKLYGVKNTFGILPGRTTFVIDQNGIIRFTFSSQFHIQHHIDETLKFAQSINTIL